MFGLWRSEERSARAAGLTLYSAAVVQARQPVFYRSLGVPDSVDGRFEMIALHVFLLLHRLKVESAPQTRALARALSEALFDDMDRSLREMGAGDLGVGKRVQTMAQGFYGRVAAYDSALGDAGAGLEQAVRRNIYGTRRPDAAADDQVAAMCAYFREAVAALSRREVSDLAHWPEVPALGDRP